MWGPGGGDFILLPGNHSEGEGVSPPMLCPVQKQRRLEQVWRSREHGKTAHAHKELQHNGYSIYV